MQVNILTPDSQLYSGEASLVQFPGSGGSFEVLNNHAPIIASLAKGTIKVITNDKQTLNFEITGGVVDVNNNNILVLA